MKILLQIRKRGGIWHLSLQGDKDRTSVKEDIGLSYKKIFFFFHIDKNQIMFKHNPSEMSMKPMKAFNHYQTTNFRLFQTERVCRQQFQI